MRSSSQIEEQAAKWIVRRDQASWSDGQQLEFERWLNESTAHRVAWLRLDSAWRRAGRLSSLRMPGRASVSPTAPMLGGFPFWRVAAGFVILVALGATLKATGVLGGAPSFDTAIGESRTVTLADGSRVILNTNTHLRAEFNEQQRRIWLDKGEAYFEVVHNASCPFVVDVGGHRIEDVGTKFSVRRNQDQVSVVVLDGQVQVTSKDATLGPTLVSRNETVVAAVNKIVVVPRTAEEVSDLLDWREGKLVLSDMTLAQAAREFNRYNRKQLLIDGQAVGRIRVGGRFDVNNVEGLARLLHEGFGLKVVEDGNIIRVSAGES